MKLYQSSLSPNAKRVRVLAKELGLPLTVVELDFAKGENRAPEYLAKNPMAKVPTLEDDDGYLLWESPAQLVYLAARHPDKGFLPADARGRAETMRWMFWNASHFEAAVHAVANERIIKAFRGLPADEARVTEAMKDVDRYAPVLNGHLEGKQFIVQNFTIADIALGTTVDFAALAKIDFGRYPHLNAWHKRLKARPSWDS